MTSQRSLKKWNRPVFRSRRQCRPSRSICFGRTTRAACPRDDMGTRDKEKAAEYQRAWAKRNPDRTRAAKARWRAKHREANAARRREYRRLNREKLDAAKRKWERDNPERVAAARAVASVRRKQNALSRDLVWRYGITIDDYFALLVVQGNRCAICPSESGDGDGSRLFLDHCHATGRVRGLLCNRCNSALGYMRDDPSLLRRAANYLETMNESSSTADTRTA